jgi:hypothetical protein
MSLKSITARTWMTVGLNLAVVVVIGAVAVWLAQSQPLRGKVLIYGLAGGAGLLALLRTCIKKEGPGEKGAAGGVGASTDKVLEFGSIILMTALMVNLGSNRLQAWIDKAPPSAADLYRNHDLSRITGMAIASIIARVADGQVSPADSRILYAIADQALDNIGGDDKPRHQWQGWMVRACNGKTEMWKGIDQDALVEFVRDPTRQALTPLAWQSFLVTSASDAHPGRPLGESARDLAAQRLGSDFGSMVREILKHDYATGGEASKAFAAMHLDVSGELLRGSEELQRGMNQLLARPVTLTMYHVAGPNDRREITLDYEHVPLDQQMRLKIDNADESADAKSWCILTIDGQGAVALVKPEQLQKDADGLYAWQATAASSETVILLVTPSALSAQQQADITRQVSDIMQRSGAPVMESGYQIVWGEDAGGWKRVKNGRGAAVAPSDDDGWPTQVCNVLREVPELKFTGRTVAVTAGR